MEALEVGYSKHKNPYHNLIHAADVTQTVHYLLLKTGMVVSSLECILISSKETNRTKKKKNITQSRHAVRHCLTQRRKAAPYPTGVLISLSVFFPLYKHE